jgi:hypothetical protein
MTPVVWMIWLYKDKTYFNSVTVNLHSYRIRGVCLLHSCNQTLQEPVVLTVNAFVQLVPSYDRPAPHTRTRNGAININLDARASRHLISCWSLGASFQIHKSGSHCPEPFQKTCRRGGGLERTY